MKNKNRLSIISVSGMDNWSLLPGCQYGGYGSCVVNNLCCCFHMLKQLVHNSCAIELSGSSDFFLKIVFPYHRSVLFHHLLIT